MPKLSRRSRRVLVVLLLSPVAALLLLNLALNLPPLKPWLTGKVEAGCERAGLGKGAKLGFVSYWPWSGARLHRLRVGDPDAPLLEAGVRVKFGLFKFVGSALTGGGFEFSEIVFDDPSIRLPLPPAGEAFAARPPPELPALAQADDPEPTTDTAGETPSKSPGDEPSPSKSTPASPAPVVAAAKDRRDLRFRKLVLRGGEIVIEDAPAGREILRVDSFEFEFEPGLESDVRFVGDVSIGTVSLFGHALGGGGSAQVEVKSNVTKISEVRLPAGGGEILGAARIENKLGRPFLAEFRAASLDLGSLLPPESRDGAASVLAAGAVNGLMRLRGWVDAPGETRGRIKVSSSGLQLRMGEGVSLTGLAAGEMPGTCSAAGEATVDLAGGNLLVTAASLRSGALWFKAAGSVDRSGALDLSARLYTGGGLHSGFVRNALQRDELGGGFRFQWLPGTDWHFRDFRVSGRPGSLVADFWNPGEPEPIAELWSQPNLTANALVAGPRDQSQ